MADIASPSLTKTITECWVFTTTQGVATSVAAEPIATGAQCYELYPTGGGVEMTPIPNSQAMPAFFPSSTAMPSASASSSSSSGKISAHQVVGPVVGSVVGILLLAVPIMWYMTYRERRRRRALEKHQWAMKPGKWVTDEQKKPVERVGEMNA